MSIESIHFLHGGQYGKMYSTLNLGAVAIIKLKPNIHPLTLIDVLNKYHISIKYKNSKVKINDDSIDFPETLVISSSEISSVKIIEDSSGDFINIITVDYPEVKKLKDQMKKGEIFVK